MFEMFDFLKYVLFGNDNTEKIVEQNISISRPKHSKFVLDIMEMAQLTRKYYWMEHDTTTLFLYRILDAKRVKVEYGEFGKDMYMRDGQYVITLPRYTNPYHDNYTIATNIGKLILDIKLKKYYTKGEVLKYNIFASELVMPEELFIEKFLELKGDVYAMSNYFCVSSHAVLVKKSILKLD